eukprot:14296596-Ditylum_brightwellii.AAC.1
MPVSEVRTLEMHFPIREIETLYQSKPTRYISHLVGHEGFGSILQLLKDLGYANELSAGEMKSCSDWSSFGISIDLTDEGLESVEDVVVIAGRKDGYTTKHRQSPLVPFDSCQRGAQLITLVH